MQSSALQILSSHELENIFYLRHDNMVDSAKGRSCSSLSAQYSFLLNGLESVGERTMLPVGIKWTAQELCNELSKARVLLIVTKETHA